MSGKDFSSRLFFIFLSILLVSITGTSLFFVFIINKHRNEKQIVTTDNTVPFNQPTIYNPPTIKPLPTIHAYQYVLMNKNEAVYTFDYENKIVRWENQLIFIDKGKEIVSYNILTGDKTIIFTNPGTYAQLYSIYLIQDELFITENEYMKASGLYSIKLNKNSTAEEVGMFHNARIETYNDKYFLVEGEGDACWGYNKYSLFTPATHTVQKIAEANMGCTDGENFIGMDKSDRLIFTGYDGDTADFGANRIFTYIIGVGIRTPDIKEGIVAKQDMPADIRYLKLNDMTNTLLLVGNSLYSYSIDQNQLKKITDIPEEWKKADISTVDSDSNILCFNNSASQTKPSKTASINLKTGEIVPDVIICQQRFSVYSDQQQLKNRSEKIFKELSLPSQFTLSEQ